MNFQTALLVLAAAASSVSAKHTGMGMGMGGSGSTRLEECEVDCDVNRDCQRGLMCANGNSDFLQLNRLDARKAYCGDVGGRFAEVCFDPDKVVLLLDECEVDCDSDSDCQSHLVCAKGNEAKLKAAGYDRRKAYCGDVGAKNAEVCFDPYYL